MNTTIDKYSKELNMIQEKYIQHELERDQIYPILNKMLTSFASEYSSTVQFDCSKLIEIFILLDKFKTTLDFEDDLFTIVTDEISHLNTELNQISNDFSSDYNFNQKESNNLNRPNFSNNEQYLNMNQLGTHKKPKTKRSNYPKKISKILKQWLMENMNNPYPSDREKAFLMHSTGLDSTQINNWFINARRRILPYMKSKYVQYDD
ncbi:transcription factor, TALE/PBX fam [Nucleospora cyclopteri]